MPVADTATGRVPGARGAASGCARRDDRAADALGQLLQGACECLAACEHGLEQVAVPVDPCERLAHPEATRRDVLRELVPAKRRRDRCARLRAYRVDGGDRLPPRVLTVVDEHALALALQPFGRDQSGVPLLQSARY